MSQFDRYDNPTLPKECEWEVFPDKDNPNIINIRFGKYREVTIPNKYQWEDGQKIRVLDIPAYSIQTCDFSVNGMSEEIVHFIGDDGLIGIPNKLFEHHGDVKCFINHIGEDNTTIVRVVNFKINARPKPENYISPEDEPTFREWIQETLDKGTIKDITEEESLEDGGVNVVTITMNDDNTYTFYVHNGNKGETGNTPEFSIGTVESIPAGQPPYVTITGTKDEPVLNFGLVRGSNGQGVTLRNVTIIEDSGGTRGEVIPVGEVVGMTTYDIKLYNIKGANGVNGTDGDKINDATINSDSGSTRVVLRVVGMTVNGGKIYDFDFYNIKGDSGEGVPVGGTTGQILVKKSDEDYDTEWVEIPTSVNVVQEEGQSTEDVMSQKAVSDSLESIRDNKMDKDDSAVEDNIAIFDANGNVVDSGVNLDNIQVECDDHLDTESENPVQNKVLADIIPYKADYTYVNNKVDELNTSIGTKASTSYVDTELAKKANASDVETALSGKADVTDLPDSDELVPSFSITEAGKVLTVANDGESTTWTEIPQPHNELPNIETGDAGKVLTVNQAEDGVEWAEVPKELPSVTNIDDGKLLGVSSGAWAKVDAPKELPTVSSGDSGKALMVNGSGNWVADNIPNELPTVTSVDEGKVLTVDSSGDWIADNVPTELPAVTGSDNGKLLGVSSGSWSVVNAPSSLPSVTGADEGKVLTVDSQGDWVADNVPTELPAVTGADEGKVLAVDSNGDWGAEAVPILPSVTVADEGDVLTVNASGQWENLPPASSGTMSFSGSGAPISTIPAKEGDIYRDVDTDRLYICSQYVNPLYVTNLKGLTITLPTAMPLPANGFDDVSYQFGGTYSATLRIQEYTGSSLSMDQLYYNMTVTTSESKIVVTRWLYGAFSRTMFSDTQTTLFGSSSLTSVVLTFPDNVDVTSTKLVRWFIDNATNVVGAGSIWKEVYALPDGIPNGSYDRAILQWDSSTGKWLSNGGTIDLRSNGNTSNFVRLNPGSSVEIWSSGSTKARINTDDITFVSKGSTAYPASPFRSNFNLLGGRQDTDTITIASNMDLNQAQLCRVGNYGYVSDAVAATLTNCPTNGHGFTFKVLSATNTYYTNTNYLNNSYNTRVIITYDSVVYIQNAWYATSGNWTFGDWQKITTSAEVPSVDTTTDGTYVLKCAVSSGVPTYAWVLET